MSWFDRMSQGVHIAKVDANSPGPILDTSRGRSHAQEVADADARLRAYKRDTGAIDLHRLAISGARNVVKTDVADATLAMKVMWFHLEYPLMAANARDQSDLERMAAALWDTVPLVERARFVAGNPDTASPDSDNGQSQTKPSERRMKDDVGGGELDTSRMSVDAWTAARAVVRKAAKADPQPDVIVSATELRGDPRDRRTTVCKADVHRVRCRRAYAARDVAARAAGH